LNQLVNTAHQHCIASQNFRDTEKYLSTVNMLIIQLLYIKPGAEKIFDEFEALAIPIISKYNGRLLLRLRPDKASVLENNIPEPYEMHLVEFKTEEDFKNFLEDEERQRYLSLKEQAIQSSILIKGTQF